MTILDGSLHDGPLNRSVDVVVIGSGAGGANVALRLVEQGINTLMLELGGAYKPGDFSQEEAVATTMLWSEFGMRMCQGDANFPVPGANALGGSTVINAGICFRPPGYMRDRWHQKHGAEWATPERLDPVVDWVWETMHVKPVPEAFMGTHNQMSLNTFRHMGWHAGIIDRNEQGCIGCGVCYFGCPSGGKWSVDKAQIPAALELGLDVVTRARVEQILWQGSRAKGVHGVLLEQDGKTIRESFRIDAKAVVVCAGGVNSATLLQKSGFGGPESGIGDRFHVHPGAGCLAYFPDVQTEIWRGVPQGAYSDEYAHEGFLFESSNLPASTFYVLGAKIGEDPAKWMQHYPHIALAGGMLRDEGRGRVTEDPWGKSNIRMWFSENDLTKARRSIQLMGEAYLDYGAEAVMPNIQGASMVRNKRELAQQIARVEKASDISLYGSHPQSTVPFDANPKRAPLHPNFHLHGIPNLFVADASVFPEALGVNPQITIMALGRIAGDYVAASL